MSLAASRARGSWPAAAGAASVMRDAPSSEVASKD